MLKNNIPIFILLTFCPNLEKGNEIKEVVENDLERIFYNIDQKNGLNYYEKQVKIFPVHLLDEIDNSYQNFGLNIVFELYYWRK